ncbi:MAG: VIT1/CCC1 transporter family protein [Candidatus Pacebacteria bacterium]|nr:VIT1/CCC1 transporter family protein [Candidatus Paceibacterota bacterium]MBP9701240.1 VIT1/CCC1 transporter family protein [Candidatus Paceibacterota bacterium]
MVKKTFILYTRNFIFGSEDSLVSTVGLLAGIASAGVARREILISGIVLICVEAFSMSVGSFLSETATEESSKIFEKNSTSIMASAIMFISYSISGLIPLFPYFVMDTQHAFWWSIVASIISLFILGYISAKILKINVLKSTLRMALIGGMAIGLGVVVGLLMK